MAFDETNIDAALTAILDRGQPMISGAGELSVTLLHGQDADTAASTGCFAALLDQWQYRKRPAGPDDHRGERAGEPGEDHRTRVRVSEVS